MKKTAVVLPTYDEAGNIVALIEELFDLEIDGLEVFVMDDASPDGTAKLAEALRPRYPGLHVVNRAGPAGRGLAGRDGFILALKSGADFIAEMDADFSHQPRQLPALLEALADCDVAVGSRMAQDGRDARQNVLRRFLTKASAAFARFVLSSGVRDVNSGYRCFTREALEKIEPATLRSRGSSIVHETLYRAARENLRIKEVPIDFIDRRQGRSKLGAVRLLAGSLWIVRLRLGL